MVEGDAPVLALTAQPFVSTNAFEQRLLYQLAKPTYADILKKFNQFTLYTSVWPFSGIYTQRPIKSAADLKGLKMRVYDGTGLAFGEATGIAARKMPFSEVYPAMKAGLLDSMYTSSVSGVDAKAWEVLKYFTPINIVGPVNMVNVNLEAWNKLPKEIQAKVLEIAVDDGRRHVEPGRLHGPQEPRHLAGKRHGDHRGRQILPQRAGRHRRKAAGGMGRESR